MRRVIAIAVWTQFWAGCVALPEEGDETVLLDDAATEELVLDGGSSRPPVGQPYRGPQCATMPSAGHVDGGAAVDGDDGVATPAAGAGGGDNGQAGGGGAPGLPMTDAGTAAPMLPRPKRAGDLVITEIMLDPKGRSDTDGEWIELWSSKLEEALSLEGCVLDDGASTPRKLDPLVIEPLAFATIGRANAGFVPDLIAAISLTNTSDTVALLCDGVEIDRVSYDGTFPLKPGVSLSLDPALMTPLDNDDPSSWCPAVDDYGGDLGTPGTANPSCTPSDAGTL